MSVRYKDSGRHHNQRMADWECGKDIKYIRDACEKSRIECFTGTERGTSSRCPECGSVRKQKGRWWRCRKCGFEGHRDVVGSANMHLLAFGTPIRFPKKVTYLQPCRLAGGGMKSLLRPQGVGSSSRSDTSLSSPGLAEAEGERLAASRLPGGSHQLRRLPESHPL